MNATTPEIFNTGLYSQRRMKLFDHRQNINGVAIRQAESTIHEDLPRRATAILTSPELLMDYA